MFNPYIYFKNSLSPTYQEKYLESRIRTSCFFIPVFNNFFNIGFMLSNKCFKSTFKFSKGQVSPTLINKSTNIFSSISFKYSNFNICSRNEGLPLLIASSNNSFFFLFKLSNLGRFDFILVRYVIKDLIC